MFKTNKKVLVAMSGGVDSSVAAYLLREAGCDVVGVSMQLYRCHRAAEKTCCTASDRLHARRVCEKLGVPFYTVDYQKRFQDQIIGPFLDEYLRGRTPSPCILCNEHLKFGALFEEMEKMGASYVATGHYARITTGPGNLFRLQRGGDPKKDQSYFLFTLKQKDLSRILFPLGSMTKDEVKTIARRQGLWRENRRESQEICFVPDGDFPAFIETACPERIPGPGNFVDHQGRVLGSHRGIHAYTIGQRRGLGLAAGHRQFVVKIDPGKNEVTLGADADLFRKEMTVKELHWIVSPDEIPSRVAVKIRSVHIPAPATLSCLDDQQVQVLFDEPQRAITPGQAAVFYSDDEVLGGGWIA